MEQMRSTWTDSRLDDFRADMKDEFAWVRDEFALVRGELSRQGERIDSLTHTILVVGGSLFAAFVAVIAAILGLIATQL